jgi:uncharacterized protein (DUF3820 family)
MSYQSFIVEGGRIKFLFGKYKCEYLDDIEDVEYLKWIVREYAEKKNFNESLVVEIEEELKSRGIDIKDI